MSKALSLDLRVLAAVAGGSTHREAAERFGVSAASVSRWRTREREQGNPRPKAPEGARRRSPLGTHRGAFRGRLRRARAGGRPHAPGGAPHAGRTGSRLRLRNDPAFLRPPRDHAQKKTAHAAEQERPDIVKQREDWFEGQLDLDPARLVFIDETLGSSPRAGYGLPPTWPAVMGVAGAASACASACHTATGRRPHSSARSPCAASSRPSCSTGRSTGAPSRPMLRRFSFPN